MAWWLPKKQRAEKSPVPTRGLAAATQAIRMAERRDSNQASWFQFLSHGSATPCFHPEGCLESLAGQSASLLLTGRHPGHLAFPETVFPKAL